MKEYSQIKKEIEGLDFSDRIATQIALCVFESAYDKLTDEKFNALCNFVYICWNKSFCGYMQLIADVVVDCYMDCGYGYRKKAGKLTLKQLKEANYEDRERIFDVIYDAYQGGLF